MNLVPGTTHSVRWTKQNLVDTATYYVRAIIRDTRSDAILATFNLADLDGKRFSYPWNVAEDPTGQGREIEIEFTVYEDSAYTQVSAMYGRWTEEYIISDPRLAGQAFGGGGGTTDYSFIADLLRKEIQKAVADLRKMKEVDLSGVEKRLDLLAKGVEKAQKTAALAVAAAGSAGEKEENARHAMQGLSDAVAEASGNIRDAGKEAQNNFEKAARGASTAFAGDIRKEADAERKRFSDDFAQYEGRLSAKIDQEMTYIVSKLKAVMEASAEALHGKIENLSKTLEKPMQVVLPAHREKDPQNRERTQDMRPHRMLSAMQI